MSIISKFIEEGSVFDGDLNGALPTGPLSDGNVLPVNTTFKNGQYLDNLPNGIPNTRLLDNTGNE